MTKFKLLTENDENAKLAKGEKFGYANYGLHLLPADLSGHNVCPMATAGCKVACLNTAGMGKFANVQLARLNKTNWFFENRATFLRELEFDIQIAIIDAKRKDLIPSFRLNLTSDIQWEKYGIIQKFPKIQFMDYTKIFNRLMPDSVASKLKNYHLTFSLSEKNLEHAKLALAMKKNVAVVFHDELPKTFLGKRVIDGDISDIRFKDPKNVIVGLSAKGKAKYDETGFVN